MPWAPLSSSFLFTAAVLSCIGTSVRAETVSTTVNPAIYQYVCPAGFDLVNGQCRGFAQYLASFEDMKVVAKNIEICSGLNGYPPIIHNAEDNSYWSTEAQYSSVNILVIGIICNVTSNTWTWADGSKIDYKPTHYNTDLDRSCSSDDMWYFTRSSENWNCYSGSEVREFNLYCTTDLKKPEIREDDCINFEKSDSICYQVSNDAQQWSDAENTCKSVGANLASIHSDQENSYIRRLAVSGGFVDGLMLGATSSGKGNTFAWLDGSEWNYTNFIPGFPIDGFGDCLVMETADTNGQWANNDCSAKLPFVCSRKPFTDSPPQTCLGANIKEGDIVRTPGFPADASTFCDFFLKVDAGKLVEIEVLLLEANTCCDHFIIEEGSFGGNLIANLTGASMGMKFRTNSSNMMRASWQPNGGVNVRGAMFTFRAV